MIPLLLERVKCHTSDFRVKYKFLTSFIRPSGLTPLAPVPLSSLSAARNFILYFTALFQYSVYFLWGICNNRIYLLGVHFLSPPLGVSASGESSPTLLSLHPQVPSEHIFIGEQVSKPVSKKETEDDTKVIPCRSQH